MKFVRVTGAPRRGRAPELFDLLADSTFVSEARLYDWNLSRGASATALFEVDGDVERFRAAADGVPGVRSVDTTPVSAGRFTLLFVLEPTAVPLLKGLFDVVTQEGVVVAKPIRYRDGRVHAQLVGRTSALQRAVDSFPAGIAIDVSAIGEYNRSRRTPMSGLSPRQREALVEAFRLGYYEFPRRATHEDVASRLDCAPNTASEHLQKAEMKVLTDGLRRELER